jgi:prepilin-type N-terminal cleavage/methylation domain-containing protein
MSAATQRAGFTLTELVVVILIIVVLLALLGFGVPFSALFYLLVGWALFFWRVVPAVRPDGAAVLSGLVCLAALAVGLHLFCRWLYSCWGRAGEGEDAPRSTWRPRWTATGLGAVVLMFVAGLSAVGLLRQTTWLVTAREPLVEGSSLRKAAARVNSGQNLKQIAIAAHNYHDDKHGHLPPGATFDAAGRALHGWQTLLLPYIEQEDLYKRINLSLPWDDPANASHFRTIIKSYLHPTATPTEAGGYALSHYAGNAHVLGGSVPLTLGQIDKARGRSQTILAGEAAGNFKPWGHPVSWRDPARGLNRSPDGFGNPAFPGQPTQLVMADGSVRSFTADTDPEFLELLALPQPRK